jgi:DNA-binding MarR family transcriptional regulator
MPEKRNNHNLIRLIYAKPGYLFRRMQQIFLTIFMEMTSDYGITPAQYGALAAIREYPGIDQLRLGELIDFDRNTIGGIVRRLQAKKLIRRLEGEDDRRRKVLHITNAGDRLLDDMFSVTERAQQRALHGLSASEKKQLIGLLTRLVELHSAPPSAAKSANDR